MKQNAGRIVELADGRHGLVFNRDIQHITRGKVPVYTTSAKIEQGKLFNGSQGHQQSLFQQPQTGGKKIMVDPKDLKTIGFFD